MLADKNALFRRATTRPWHRLQQRRDTMLAQSALELWASRRSKSVGTTGNGESKAAAVGEQRAEAAEAAEAGDSALLDEQRSCTRSSYEPSVPFLGKWLLQGSPSALSSAR